MSEALTMEERHSIGAAIKGLHDFAFGSEPDVGYIILSDSKLQDYMEELLKVAEKSSKVNSAKLDRFLDSCVEDYGCSKADALIREVEESEAFSLEEFLFAWKISKPFHVHFEQILEGTDSG